MFGWQTAAESYIAVMPAAVFVALPIIRAFGEAGEHDYSTSMSDDVIGNTFDNIGFLNGFIHPFGDGWHVAHHLAPGIPQANLGRVTREIVRVDKRFASYARRRTGLLTKPKSYSRGV
jgi:fatty acid desaturase